MKRVIIFVQSPKNQVLYKSTTHISSNNSKSTNHTSLTGTDHCYSKLSKNTTLQKKSQENQRKNYISGVAQAVKSKVLIIHAATYNIQCSYFHISLYHFFFQPSLSYFLLHETHSKICQVFILFDSNLLQPAFDFTIIFHTKRFHYKLQVTFQNKKNK